MNEGKEQDLSTALFEGLKSDDFKEVIKNGAELGIDAILDDGVLRDVPIVSTILGITKTATNIRDLLLTKKILRFLNELNKVPLYERKKFFNDHLQDKKERQKTGEKILLLLERHEELEKSSIIGTLFAAYIQERLNTKEFDYLAHSVDKCAMSDMKTLLDYFDQRIEDKLTAGVSSEKKDKLRSVIDRLYLAGFSTIDIKTTKKLQSMVDERLQKEPEYETTTKYSLNEHTIRFAEILLREHYDHNISNKDLYYIDPTSRW